MAENTSNSSTYTVSEDETFDSGPVSSEMFGSNLVTHFDFEFAGNEELVAMLEQLGISILRYPGGSVTEDAFSEASFVTGDWNATSFTTSDGDDLSLISLREYFAIAQSIGADAQVVIPTRVAFEESAGQAIASGTYGDRTEIADDYWTQLQGYIDEVVSLSEEYGVEVASLEIGNEFWGSGEMTAGEYGFLAGEIAEFLETNYGDTDIIVQVTSSGSMFSPVRDTEIYLEPTENGDYIVHLASEFSNVLPDGWTSGVISGLGNAVTQTELIAEGILANSIAVEAIDGIVNHVYFSGGFDGIDGERDFALGTIPQSFASTLGVDDLDYYVTEWSPRNPRYPGAAENAGNASGLQYSHSVVEAFFELVSNGVDSANFWPLTFGSASANQRVLVDTDDGDLTFGGVVFDWLSANTVGMTALFDYSVSGEIDMHGFGDADGMAVFVSDRGVAADSANGVAEVGLSVGAFLSSTRYLVTVSRLNSSDGSYDNSYADPVVSGEGAFMVSGDTFYFDMSSWDLAMVVIQYVTDGADTLSGSDYDDVIAGGGGNDVISGLAGNDVLKGQDGDDRIYAGDGNDTVRDQDGDNYLEGGSGHDILKTGDGADTVFGGIGRDSIRAMGGEDYLDGGAGRDTVWGGQGNDTLIGGEDKDLLGGANGNDSLLGEAGDDTIYGGSGNDYAEGGSDNDRVWLSHDNDSAYGGDGNDSIGGGAGDDLLSGDAGDDLVYGGTDNDTLSGGEGSDTLWSGSGNDVAEGNAGDDVVGGGEGDDAVYGNGGDDEVWGGDGDDYLYGGSGNDTLDGETGADVFVFSTDHGDDVINRFEAGVDQIWISIDGAGFDNLSQSDTDFGLLIDTGAGTILFAELTSADLSQSDFLFF